MKTKIIATLMLCMFSFASFSIEKIEVDKEKNLISKIKITEDRTTPLVFIYRIDTLRSIKYHEKDEQFINGETAKQLFGYWTAKLSDTIFAEKSVLFLKGTKVERVLKIYGNQIVLYHINPIPTYNWFRVIYVLTFMFFGLLFPITNKVIKPRDMFNTLIILTSIIIIIFSSYAIGLTFYDLILVGVLSILIYFLFTKYLFATQIRKNMLKDFYEIEKPGRVLDNGDMMLLSKSNTSVIFVDKKYRRLEKQPFININERHQNGVMIVSKQSEPGTFGLVDEKTFDIIIKPEKNQIYFLDNLAIIFDGKVIERIYSTLIDTFISFDFITCDSIIKEVKKVEYGYDAILQTKHHRDLIIRLDPSGCRLR